jgi:Ca2+-binding EF-hand superfamily protein
VSSKLADEIKACKILPATVDHASMSKLELGLKQAFVAADTDGTGKISSDELLAVIKKGKTKDKGKGKSNEFLSDDPLSLLLPLVSGEGEAEFDLSDDNTVNSLCHKLFHRLDKDDDGTISWWEWMTVITAKLMIRAEGTLVNPLDGIILALEAANNAVLAHQTFRTLDIVDNVPFIKVGETVEKSISTEDADLAALENIAPAKAVPRLQNMVKSLRNNNNLLSQRLEKALLASQGISEEYEIIDGKLSPRRAQADIDFYKQEVAAVTRKQKDIEGQYKNVHSAFLIEKQVLSII